MRNGSAAGRPQPGDKPMMPPTFMMIAVAAMIVLHLAVPVARLAEPPATWLGGPLIAVGLVLNLWADALFRRARTTVKPFAEARVLLRRGPFRLCRNPMYLGMVLAALGFAMLMGTLAPFVVVPVLAWLLRSRFIAVEEAMLEDTFGDDYRRYRREVRRWL